MTIKKYAKLIITALIAALLVILLFATVPKSFGFAASAATADMTSSSISSYDIECTVNEDSSADITETVTLYYEGHFTRTIPLDNKARIKNVKLYEVETDGDSEVYTEAKYSVTSEKNSATIHAKNEGSSGRETFLITYTFVNLSLSKNKSDDALYLTSIGAGWTGSIGKPTLTVHLPDGFLAEKSEVYHGPTDSFDGNAIFMEDEYGTSPKGIDQCERYLEDSNTIVYTPYENVAEGLGMSLTLRFDKGVLSSGTGDILPWLLLIIILLIAGGAIALRLTVFNRTEPIKELFTKRNASKGPAKKTAKDAKIPEPSADPLTCRRALELKIEDRDVVSLLFFWAEKGYIKISAKAENNPVFIKSAPLPEDAPNTWKNLYDALFSKTDRATIKSVTRYIYPEIAAVRESANRKRETSFSKKAVATGCVFSCLAALFAALLPVFLPMRVSAHAFSPIYFVVLVPALLIFAFFAAIYATRHKNSRRVTILFTALALIYSAACVVLYCVFVPAGSFGLGPKIITALLVFAASAASATFILRSDKYNEKLREVNETRDYIIYTPRYDIEKALEKEPYLYYELLPYALLLRIGTTWSEKFKGMTISTPLWLVTDEKNARFAVMRDTIKNTYDTVLTQTLKAGAGKKR